MAKLTPILDYNDTKNKGKVKGYKVALKKTGVENISKMNEKTEKETECETFKLK